MALAEQHGSSSAGSAPEPAQPRSLTLRPPPLPLPLPLRSDAEEYGQYDSNGGLDFHLPVEGSGEQRCWGAAGASGTASGLLGRRLQARSHSLLHPLTLAAPSHPACLQWWRSRRCTWCTSRWRWLPSARWEERGGIASSSCSGLHHQLWAASLPSEACSATAWPSPPATPHPARPALPGGRPGRRGDQPGARGQGGGAHRGGHHPQVRAWRLGWGQGGRTRWLAAS